MFFAEGLGGDVVGASHEKAGAGEVSGGLKEFGQHAHGAGGFGVLRSPDFFGDGEGAAVKRVGFIEPAFLVQAYREVEKGGENGTMLETERVLVDQQGTAQK